MKCPECRGPMSLISPGYGERTPPTFACYTCDPYGRRFALTSPEAWAESVASRALSAKNAAARGPAKSCKHHGALFCQECPQPVRSIHFDVTKREPAEDE